MGRALPANPTQQRTTTMRPLFALVALVLSSVLVLPILATSAGASVQTVHRAIGAGVETTIGAGAAQARRSAEPRAAASEHCPRGAVPGSPCGADTVLPFPPTPYPAPGIDRMPTPQAARAPNGVRPAPALDPPRPA